MDDCQGAAVVHTSSFGLSFSGLVDSRVLPSGLALPTNDHECHDHLVQEDNVTSTGTAVFMYCLLYTSPSPRDATLSRMPSSA